MHPIDWLIIAAYLVWIVWDGLRLTKSSTGLDGYLLAGRRLPWWAVGLSVMATQLSAITMTTTTGQGYAEGMRFLQFYFALPVAMIVLSVTLVPFFHKARIYTAYEYLERRYDAKTRALTSLLFLISRGMSTGVVIAAPAVILSVILGLSLTATCLLIALPTALYTMFGGVEAVAWTDVKQMAIIVGGLLAAVVALVVGLPDGVGLGEALQMAGATGRMQTFDFRFDLTERFTFWSGTLASFFLFCSYFGTDQSQVQRYLTAKSVDEARTSLLMSAYWKIPLQALVLLVGVLMFVFYVFTKPPLLFNKAHESRVKASERAPDYAAAESRFSAAFEAQRQAGARFASARRAGEAAAEAQAAEALRQAGADMRSARADAVTITKAVSGESSFSDVNYVFPTFVLEQLPVGLVGLLIAAILAAAMSTISAELASLSTATVIDFYRRWWAADAPDGQLLWVSRVAVGVWGLFASVVAIYAVNLGSLIEVVNRFGSYFYGSLLGVFILALAFPRTNGHGAFAGVLGGLATVWLVATQTPIEFLWLNVVGPVAVCLVGVIVSALTGGAPTRAKV
jgi:SSS family solute:Na+ symporter